MAYSWKIIKAAVEQVIQFPSEASLRDYVTKLCDRKHTYEIVSKEQNEDGTLTVVMRKQYNNNEFLGSADELLP